jgi:hypothetical protein
VAGSYKASSSMQLANLNFYFHSFGWSGKFSTWLLSRNIFMKLLLF